jgi:hypothetical protein
VARCVDARYIGKMKECVLASRLTGVWRHYMALHPDHHSHTLSVVRRNRGRLAQLVRAPALQAGCRGFESLTAHQPSFQDQENKGKSSYDNHLAGFTFCLFCSFFVWNCDSSAVSSYKAEVF